MQPKAETNELVYSLRGRIDSTNAAETGAKIRAEMAKDPGCTLVLDASELTYISSAGLRILLELRKTTQEGIVLREVSPEIYDVLNVTGLTQILDIRRKMRELSVENCPVIGEGAVGTVYRLDPDTIVKVYKLPDCLRMLENEQKLSKLALVRGIPTAIPYDVVRVGERYGAVYEMVQAENCNDLLVRFPERREELVSLYVKLLKTVHGVEMAPGVLPDARDTFLGYLDALREVLPEDAAARLRELLSEMPEDLHVIHGDIQMKNVMVSETEPLLIDMETLSTGNPVFEFAGLFMTYVAFNEDDRDNSMQFLGISDETSEWIYQETLRRYLGLSGDALREAEERIQTLAYVRYLYVLCVMKIGEPALHEIRVLHATEHLRELLGRVKRLDI